MSLYNLMHGINPGAGIVLGALGVTPAEVPRFRDAYIESDTRLAIHTRTGGGNRDYYEAEERCRSSHPEYFEDGEDAPSGPWNSDLRKLPGFLYDADDEYDCTYATFYYEAPKWLTQFLAAAPGLIADKAPAEKWREALNALTKGDEEAVAKAKKIFNPIIEKIHEAWATGA